MFNEIIRKTTVTDGAVITGQLDNVDFDNILIEITQTPAGSNPVNATKEDFRKMVFNSKIITEESQTINIMEDCPLDVLIDYTDMLGGLGSEVGDVTYFIARVPHNMIRLRGQRQLKMSINVGALKGSTINSTITVKVVAVTVEDIEPDHHLVYSYRSLGAGSDTKFANVVSLSVVDEDDTSTNETLITFEDSTQLRPEHVDAWFWSHAIGQLSHDIKHAIVFSSKDYSSGMALGKNLSIRPKAATNYFAVQAV